MPRMQASITTVPLIGSVYAKKLERLGLRTISDLLHHYPAKYLDRSETIPITELEPDEPATIIAEILDFKNIYTRTGKNLQQAKVADASGSLTLTWFNQPFLREALVPGRHYAFSGKVKLYRNQITLQAPEYESISQEGPSHNQIHTGRLVPVYPETAGVSSKWLRSRIKRVLASLEVTDFLPEPVRRSHNLTDLNSALHQIHFPETTADLELARRRLAFDELFLLQLQGAQKRRLWHSQRTQNRIKLNQPDIDVFIRSLPFELTPAQIAASREILADLGQTQPMNRLLEGDVGSGKTVVAAIAIYATYLSGLNSVIMAPTEILAQQHFRSLQALFAHTGITLGLQTGSSKTGLSGSVTVGTHALLYNVSRDTHLGLIIIDEQHRFGVQQRAALETLGTHPHRLTMSATPIPRTVALTLYGDLDVSIIDQMPVNRKPVKTWVVPHAKRSDAYRWIKGLLAQGDQVFVVCPLIDPSESLKLTEVKSATLEFDHIRSQFPRHQVELLHGRLKAQEKDAIITRFKDAQTDILVSTPVIEVGIDVPNATVIIIEAAERFGLAQLHQLRGRVGRGDKQSYCLLFTSSDNKTESQRLKALTRHHSGFKLAEIDLRLRGPGQVFGLSQHGFNQLKLASLSDKLLLHQTKTSAAEILRQDPELSAHPQLAAFLKEQEVTTTNN